MKKELIEKIMKDLPAGATTWEIEESLKKNLPDFSRIDEERIFDLYRTLSFKDTIKEYNSTLPTHEPVNPYQIDKDKMKDIYQKHIEGSCQFTYENSMLREYVDMYNSTLPPALVPLPKEMPEWFAPHMTRAELWDQVVSYYGTPEPKPSLPTVEELRDKMYRWVGSVDLDECEILAQNLHEKYSLPTREWWQDLKEGDKFMYAGEAYEYYGYEVNIRGEVTLWGKSTWKFRLSGCTPYTPPSAQEIIAKHNLSEEEVRVIREGKCT